VQAAAPEAEILGTVVEQMAPRGGYEVIIGSKRDATFGPALMFGMGGTGVELYRDVAVDFPPVNETLARAMIRDTKVSKLLEGYRQGARRQVALEQTLVKMSYLLVDFPEISRWTSPAADAHRRRLRARHRHQARMCLGRAAGRTS
jgi:acetyltransferase